MSAAPPHNPRGHERAASAGIGASGGSAARPWGAAASDTQGNLPCGPKRSISDPQLSALPSRMGALHHVPLRLVELYDAINFHLDRNVASDG